ncbi:MAG: ABC transporter permease [Candidatus Thorarchaeota archaeon]|nr:MAG: ABC transporter permease [Candidatus Thorarchaeota archaeon]
MSEDTSSRTSRWKDSGWYISLSGFMKEYRKHRVGILGLAVLFLFIGMAIGAPLIAEHDPDPAAKVAPAFLAPQWVSVFDPEGVVSQEYLPDPYLNDPEQHEFVAQGMNADEFTYVHYVDDPGDEDDFSHINITWSHTPGPMFWRVPPDPTQNLPDSLDMGYVIQTLEWEDEALPSDANMTIDVAVTRTGDFNTEEGALMFKVYAWLVDSSGHWEKIFQSFTPYPDGYIDRREDLSYYDIIAGWGGMIDEGEGQEDPDDTLQVVVGIAPTYVFRNYFGTSPQSNYTGTVTVSLRRVSMFAYGEYFGILGTTDKGADAWAQLIYGSRISLTIGVLATGLATIVGVIVGLTAGYFGGKTDEILMRIVDFLLVIPGLPLMMVMAAFLGPSVENIIIVISIFAWTPASRLIRSQVMAEKNKAYVESARAIGASDTYIIFRHILPNVTPILFANITLGVVGAILSESGLAFLGLTDPGLPSWGRMLADAQGTGGFSNGAWWVVVFPGLMITLLSLAFTFIGHTLDQVLNPRLRER